MSRESADQYVNGRLMNGFDYKKQQWVIDGIYRQSGEETKGVDLTTAYEHNLELVDSKGVMFLTLLHVDKWENAILSSMIHDAFKHLHSAKEVKQWLISNQGFISTN
jgi:hypothetical protein